MSGDKLVFDLANEVEEMPSIFLRKDWINILDNQNGQYNSNQSVIDTSQLCNSNKYIGYREGYLATPLLLALTNKQAAAANNVNFLPANSETSASFAIGLKNWFGTIIHSLTLDYNGTTIIQQTPFVNMWNAFKLMTSLSWQDVEDLGPTMGFYPDDPLAWSYQSAGAVTQDGKGVCNNTNMAPCFNALDGIITGPVGNSNQVQYSTANSFKSGKGNIGLLKRQLYINYDTIGLCGESTLPGVGSTYAAILNDVGAKQLWKSYVSQRVNGTSTVSGVHCVSIMAFIHLRHLHSFFNQIPLVKGSYMKLTLNLNNTSVEFAKANTLKMTVNSVSNSVGGVNPLMIASSRYTYVGNFVANNNTRADGGISYANGGGNIGEGEYIASLSIGNVCLNSTQNSLGVSAGTLARSVYLYVPAYSFNSVFEQAYISNPIKKIMYEDIYQYQIVNVGAGQTINNLVTNGIADIKSVLVLPYFSASDSTHLCATGVPVYQSPFDPAGTGCTSPLSLLTNFNVVISGQNAIYNTSPYSFSQFINQTYGCNSVNGGLTDGLSSSLINQLGFEMEYCYHYVDCSRMLPVEKSVPKSVHINGLNPTLQALDLFVFISYGCELQFDILTGARV